MKTQYTELIFKAALDHDRFKNEKRYLYKKHSR